MYDYSNTPPGWIEHGLRAVGIAPQSGPVSVVESDLFGWIKSQVLARWADPGWLGAHVRCDLLPIVGMPAGPELMAALARLPGGNCPVFHRPKGIAVRGAPPLGSAGNPCLCLLVVAAAWQACSGYAAAHGRAAVVDAVGADAMVLPREGSRPAVADPAKEDLAAALRLSPDSAATRIRQARQLAALGDLAGLLEQGELPESFALRISNSLDALSPRDATSCARRLAQQIRWRRDRDRRPWTGTDAAARAHELAARCSSYTQARKKAVAGRNVRRWANGDGTTTLSAVLPDVVAERMYRRLTAMGQGMGPDDPRGLDARRADLLADLVLGDLAAAPSGVELNVVIDAASLLGLRRGVAHVKGMGPIPAEVARELAGDAAWRAWVKDATGAIKATGTRRYRPSAALARLIRAREQHCRMAGCRRPAEQCDIDHAVPWPWGATELSNLGPLCRRHHIAKTHIGWELDTSTPGEVAWITPAGVRIVDAPQAVA